ncbi:MAG: glycosyltransferase family 2 protein [Acidobacteriota bacterium]|nr:glycosyltransferase family 2 protein [Acidobacteriota bacterium]
MVEPPSGISVSEPTRLSIVVATTHPWPFLKPCLDELLPQCEDPGVELLIADSTGECLPHPLPPSFSKIRHLPCPGASVFDLRAKATGEATGEIVAWTEDHCIPAADWCQNIRAAHEHHPDAEVIGGAVLNGSQDTSMDWSNFLCTFGPFVPPIRRSPHSRAPAVANLSIKRRALPSSPIRAGFIEIACTADWRAAGNVGFDDSILVTHVQSWGFWGTFAAHFHNGRSTTGLLADSLSSWGRIRHLLICFLMPAEVLRTSLLPLLGKRAVPWRRNLPFIFALALAFSAGEFVGLVTKGPGRSPHLLE